MKLEYTGMVIGIEKKSIKLNFEVEQGELVNDINLKQVREEAMRALQESIN